MVNHLEVQAPAQKLKDADNLFCCEFML